MTIRKLLGTIAKILIAVGIIYWMVQQDKFNIAQLKSFLVWDFLFIAIIATGINLFLVSERWRILLTTQSIHPNSLELYKLSLIGIFFNFAMPGGESSSDDEKEELFWSDPNKWSKFDESKL